MDRPGHLFLRGDARRIPLADESVDCVVTSPPYFNLRDAGTGRWEGGDPACDHLVRDEEQRRTMRRTSTLDGAKDRNGRAEVYREQCRRCGARRVDRQVGVEADWSAYVATLVAIFREVRRVLKPTGTCWLNLGDSFATRHGRYPRKGQDGRPAGGSSTIKEKDLVGIPWRVALALQADGWWLRRDIIWEKSNATPEPVRDRPTSSHEYVFLLTRSARYWYDPLGESRPVKPQTRARYLYRLGGDKADALERADREGPGNRTRPRGMRACPERARLRSVWRIPTQGSREAHYSLMPPRLARRCIRLGCPPGGIVLDPFGGRATTVLAADALGRRGIALELREDHCRAGRRRVERPHAGPRRAERTPAEEPHPLFDPTEEA